MNESPLGPTPAQVARMRRGVADKILARTRRARRQRRVVIASSAVAIVGLVTASAVVTTLPRQIQGNFSCYAADSLDATAHSISYPGDLVPPEDIAEQAAAAIELCRIAYRQNRVPVPDDPVVCRLPDLRLGVFPDEQSLGDRALCAALGLPLPQTPIPGVGLGYPTNPSGM